MIYCAKCGKALKDDDLFCSGCGSRVEADLQVETKGYKPPSKRGTLESETKNGESSGFHIEEMRWDLDGYPDDSKRRKTDTAQLNWSSVVDPRDRQRSEPRKIDDFEESSVFFRKEETPEPIEDIKEITEEELATMIAADTPKVTPKGSGSTSRLHKEKVQAHSNRQTGSDEGFVYGSIFASGNETESTPETSSVRGGGRNTFVLEKVDITDAMEGLSSGDSYEDKYKTGEFGFQPEFKKDRFTDPDIFDDDEDDRRDDEIGYADLFNDDYEDNIRPEEGSIKNRLFSGVSGLFGKLERFARFDRDDDYYEKDERDFDPDDYDDDFDVFDVDDDFDRENFQKGATQVFQRSFEDQEETVSIKPKAKVEAAPAPKTKGLPRTTAVDDWAKDIREASREASMSVSPKPAAPSNLEGRAKFYTFNQKSAEFQALLDEEYERLKKRIQAESEEPKYSRPMPTRRSDEERELEYKKMMEESAKPKEEEPEVVVEPEVVEEPEVVVEPEVVEEPEVVVEPEVVEEPEVVVEPEVVEEPEVVVEPEVTHMPWIQKEPEPEVVSAPVTDSIEVEGPAIEIQPEPEPVVEEPKVVVEPEVIEKPVEIKPEPESFKPEFARARQEVEDSDAELSEFERRLTELENQVEDFAHDDSRIYSEGFTTAYSKGDFVAFEEEAEEEPEELEEPEEERPQYAFARAIPTAKDKPTEREERALRYGDIFNNDDYDYDDSEKSGRAKLIILDILIAVLAVCVLITAILVFAGDTAVGQKLQSILGINKTTEEEVAPGGQQVEENTGEETATQEPSIIETAIQQQAGKNKNITEVAEDTALQFTEDRDYGMVGVEYASLFTDADWYTTGDGVTVKYTPELVGTVMEYYSLLQDRYNEGSDEVLNLVDDYADYYYEVAAITPEEGVTYKYNKLQIGEIRQDGSEFYVLTRLAETISTSEDPVVTMQLVRLDTSDNRVLVEEVTDVQ